MEFFQIVGEKLGFEIHTNLNWGESDPIWSLSKQSGKNWDLEFTQISIGESGPLWSLSKQSGKNWDLRFTQISIEGEFDPV